jgi:hypothetical protein
MFKPGQSGNPKGRKKGLPDKRTALRELLKPHSKALVEKVVALALAGDTAALKLCLERLMPPIRAKDEPVKLTLPENGSLTEQAQGIIQAMAQAELSPREASMLLQALAGQARIIEIDELTKRIEALEHERNNEKG